MVLVWNGSFANRTVIQSSKIRNIFLVLGMYRLFVQYVEAKSQRNAVIAGADPK